MKFGNDGCLYISTGDGGFAFPPDGRNSGQDVSNLLSSILRIDVDREEDDRPYAIPVDNPFVSLDDARGEIWAYGVRNPWKMSFDRKTGDLWVGDVGWELWELVYRVNKGDNYGWSLVEGRQPVHTERRRGPTPIVPPTVEIPHTDGASITGGFVYRGKKFPELVGTYVFGDWETRRIWGVTVDGVTVDGDTVGERKDVLEPTVRIVGFSEDNDGELYLLDYDDGTIHTLERNRVESTHEQFPRRLSDSGIFESVVEHRVAAGVMPFLINAEQWSDYATAERFIGIPGNGSIKLHAKSKRVAGSMFNRKMDFPKDAVLVKTFSLELEHGDPATRRRVETQVLHYDGRDWRGYTYAWNDEQTDAELVERSGTNREFAIKDAESPGGSRVQNWRFPSRMECIRCHNPWTEHSLAFNIEQLNLDYQYAVSSDNQIRTLRHIGIFKDVIDEPDPEDPFAKAEPPKLADELPRLVNPHDESKEVDERARSYLHVNCAHCHRFNGGGSAYVFFPYDLPLSETKSVGTRPSQGTFGIRDAEVLAPGDPYRSVLYYRMAKLGPGHMPHVGSRVVDQRGLTLIHDWIRQLPVRLDETALIDKLIALEEATILEREKENAPRTRWQIARGIATKEEREEISAADYKEADRRAAQEAAYRVKSREEQRLKLVNDLLTSPARAMLLARTLRQNELPDEIRQKIIDTTASHADIGIRDLFESFLPSDQRSQRLGETIRPSDILAMNGDAARGRKLFHETKTVQCRSCHRIRNDGTELGPDLSQIGKKYDREKLLESILEPSKNIDPKFITWLIQTDEGKVFSGLLVTKDDEQVTLKDAKNKEHQFTQSSIEEMIPQRKSMMPDLLLRDFTAQQVSDLLAYLESLK